MFWFKKKPAATAEPETDATPATDPEAANPKPSDTEPSNPKPSTPEAAEPTAAGPQVADPTPADDSPPPSTSPKSPRTVMDRMNDYMMVQVAAPPTGSTDALNSQIVEAVEFTNAQTFSYAPAQIAIAPDMMISQAAGLVAQSAAGYFDGVSKLALAAQAVLLEQMTKTSSKTIPKKPPRTPWAPWPPTCWWGRRPLSPRRLAPWRRQRRVLPSTRSTRASPSTATPWPIAARRRPDSRRPGVMSTQSRSPPGLGSSTFFNEQGGG
ncbi:hypothetical protein K9V45_15055 [Pseudomonas chlororaphis]|nr:hypothetical protein K9V45_15055 [Pseudomonas chlororaphis]